MTKQEFTWLKFHQELKKAGLTKKRADFQSQIGQLVEYVAAAVVGISGESYYDWMMTGSFVEGWGNNLFRLDGVTGIDSDIDWSQVVKHKVYHLGDTCNSVVDCINRKEYKLENGHIVVKNSSQQPAFDTKRHGLRPDADECHAYPCCSYPQTVLGSNDTIEGKQVHKKFLEIVKKQFDNNDPVEDVHFVRASVPGQVNQLRLSCTRQERYIMSQLTTVQGQLFTVLKYLFKTKEDESDPKSEKKIIESVKSYHAKTLLMTLLRDKDSWPEGNPDDEDEDKVASERLRRLVWRALGFLLKSISRSLQKAESGTDEPSENEQQPPQPPSRQVSSTSTVDSSVSKSAKSSDVPRVLDHALLSDCGLYLKPKKAKPEAKSKSFFSFGIFSRSQPAQPQAQLTEKEAHASALEKMKEDLLGLIGSRTYLDCVLSESFAIEWNAGSRTIAALKESLEKLNEKQLKRILAKFEKQTEDRVQSECQNLDTRKNLNQGSSHIQEQSQGSSHIQEQSQDSSHIQEQSQDSSQSQHQSQNQTQSDQEKLRERESGLRTNIVDLYEKLDETPRLYKVLQEYQNRVMNMSEARQLEDKDDDACQAAKFLFIPLAMLPRITLDTLLEEERRRKKQAAKQTTEAATTSQAGAVSESTATTSQAGAASESAATTSQAGATSESAATTSQAGAASESTATTSQAGAASESAATISQAGAASESAATTSQAGAASATGAEANEELLNQLQAAANDLKEAYIKVWIVLRSLSDSWTAESAESDQEEVENAKKWIEGQKFLKTTSLCLEIMEKLKDNKKEEIAEILRKQSDEEPTRWINFSNNDFKLLLDNEDCIWMFHYFIRPKMNISFDYLNEVQKVKPGKGSKVEKRVEYDKGEKKVVEYIDGVQKDWLIHLVVNQDDKKSRQPSLTVNFDGLLDCFRRQFLPSDGSTAAVPSDGSTAAVPSDGSTAAVPSDGSTVAVPSDGSTVAVPSDGSTAALQVGYLGTMKNCLFDPRIQERWAKEGAKKKLRVEAYFV